MNDRHVRKMNDALHTAFSDARKIVAGDPRMAVTAARILIRQGRARAKRLKWEAQGVHVPPYMIVSVTRRCNLRCRGCYAAPTTTDDPGSEKLDSGRLRQLFSEARDLGISVIMLAGGEPLIRPDLLEITAQFPSLVFILFTNGLLLDETVLNKLDGQRHVIPVLSLEGCLEQTDGRRGAGVYDRLLTCAGRLHSHRSFFGVSITVTRDNLELVTGAKFISELRERGARLFFYIEYVPVEEGTESLALEAELAAELADRVSEFRRTIPALFVAFPGDEAEFGGCLSAGRGFVHISPDGDVQPCPFAPYSDANLIGTTLREALQSRFLAAIREKHENDPAPHRGGCTLWEERDWVRSWFR